MWRYRILFLELRWFNEKIPATTVMSFKKNPGTDHNVVTLESYIGTTFEHAVCTKHIYETLPT